MKKRTSFVAIILALFLVPLPVFAAAKEERLPDMVEAVSKAIVNIRTEELVAKNANSSKSGSDFFRRFFSQEGEEDVEAFENVGSGVMLDPHGLIVTNEHLISKAVTIKVKFTNRQEYEANVIAADPELDMALLKIDDKKDFPFLPVNKKTVRVGERAIVIGNPYGLSSSVTTGVISALGRNLRINNKIYANLIQTDAAINPGSSGGALLDAQGNLIGIVTAIYEEGKGIGFAIPIEDVMTMLSEFVENSERRSIFGIFIDRRKDEDGQYLFVNRIIPKSPAEDVGIRAGDRIIEIDNKKIREGMKLQNVFRRVGNDRNQIKVIRGNETITINVDKIPPYMPAPIEEVLCGIRLSNIEGYAKVKFKLRQKSGVVVTRVFKGGIGERYGLKPGDVIVRINDGEVSEKKDFQTLMVEGLRRNYILYQVKRNETLFFLPIKLDTLL
jgi:serine protease Do